MSSEPYDSDDEWFDEMLDAAAAAMDDETDETDEDPVESANRVRGVEWRDVYEDDQLGISSQASQRHLPVPVCTERVGAVARVSRFLRRLILR